MASASKPRKRAPARGTKAREDQMILLASDCAEKKLRDGTAPSSLIIHYLRLGSTRNELEKEKLRLEGELLKVKAARIESERKSDEFYKNAIAAFKAYSGASQSEEFYDDEEDSDLY